MQKKCSCGNYFIPRLEKQSRCMYCILKKEPELPADDDRGPNTTQFAEWFIYHWHRIRKAAAKARREPFIFDDGIVGKEVDVPKSPSVAKMAKERGLLPRTVYKRLALGWTLDEALEIVKRKKGKK